MTGYRSLHDKGYIPTERKVTKSLRAGLLDIFGWLLYCGGNVLFWLFLVAGIVILRMIDIEVHKGTIITLVIFIPFMYFRHKINRIDEILTAIDCSLYDIKKHLNLDVTPQTQAQMENCTISYLADLVRECDTFDAVRERFIAIYGIRHWGRQCLLAERLFKEKKDTTVEK